MALWTYLQTSIWHLHLHRLALVTLLNTDKFPLPVTTTSTASFLKQFVSGIPFQSQWLRVPVWYLSNGSSLRYHSKQCRPGQMKVRPNDFLCYAGGDFVGPGTSKEARLDKIEGMTCIWSNFIFLLLFLSNLLFFHF